jgi:hypothetical protein
MPTPESNLRRNLGLVEELKKHATAEKCTPAQLALAWVLSRADYIVPISGTSHRQRLEENAAAVSLKISSDIQDALLKVFAPGAVSGLRYPRRPSRTPRNLTERIIGLAASRILLLSRGRDNTAGAWHWFVSWKSSPPPAASCRFRLYGRQDPRFRGRCRSARPGRDVPARRATRGNRGP